MIALKTTEFANQIDTGQTVGISFHYYTQRNNAFVTSLVKKVLERNNKVFLHDTVSNVLRELIINAVKANSKRFFFMSRNWNIEDINDYSNGMKQFKDYIIDTGADIEQMLIKNNLRVELYFRKVDDGIRIFVRNNSPILPNELNRVKERMEKAREYNDFAQAYEDIADTSEGEGFGILLTMLFLRNSGIGEQSLSINTDGKITQSSLTIPSTLKPFRMTTEIKKKILADVQDLPSFPNSIREIQKLCSTPETPIKTISDKILSDPSLTASVLRLSNSAGFITRSKIDSVHDAIKIIGLRNLNAILTASSARKILETKYSVYKEIWDHCHRVAFYAREIAMIKGHMRLAEEAFLAGVLHDLGKIVLLATSESIEKWVTDLSVRRNIRTSTILEEVSIGISHSTIGEMIARKWNMPDYVVESIKYHHSPILASDEFKGIVGITYLANELCNVEKQRNSYAHIESDILDMFGIDSEENFTNLHTQLKENFTENSAGN